MVWKSYKSAFLYKERPELLLLQRAYKKQKAPTHANPYGSSQGKKALVAHVSTLAIFVATLCGRHGI